MKPYFAMLLLLCAFTSAHRLLKEKNAKVTKAAKNQWFLDSLFQWLKATVDIKQVGTSSSSNFSAELNASERGIYLTNWSNFQNQDTIIRELSYPHVIEGKNTFVFDFGLIDKCEFTEVNVSMFSGYTFQYKMRNFLNFSPVKNYNVNVEFKWGSGFLGSKNPKDIISGLANACRIRMVQIQKQVEEEKREAERRRIEAEEMRKVEAEAAAKRKADEEAAKQRAAEEAAAKLKAANDAAKQKAIEEEARQKAAAAEALRKSEEQALQRKAEEEARKRALEEERKRAAEEAKTPKKEEIKPLEPSQVGNKEKEILEIANTISARYNVGFGNALYITGEDLPLGSWTTGHKMHPAKADEWTYKSTYIKDGMKFKTIISRWVDGDIINIPALQSSNQLKWENKQGPEGNKTFRFVNNLMTYTPGFNRRRAK